MSPVVCPSRGQSSFRFRQFNEHGRSYFSAGRNAQTAAHDQMLGGPSGQSYLGCIFPADPAYASAITRDAARVGELLRKAGVIGRFAIDFVVTRADKNAPWENYAIEINLRKGGTTHPFLT